MQTVRMSKQNKLNLVPVKLLQLYCFVAKQFGLVINFVFSPQQTKENYSFAN